ncbi:Eukaryotic translation initiation factor 3 subunit G [Bagarius yarrelli]|uniref:Eukaryotic translation initiation factor 3 subunit G n=1 Tax=Bagarius yarrelli TaxID=175774 RepID=A0A556UF19_BAGYA|nr:Eukaryotic translation initiation factor 3 subunit G [Bagarius yarrelli]
MAANISSSSCNSSFSKELLPPIYGVEMCVALVGNILALWLLVSKERKNWHTGVVFSCNLIISDIFYALMLPFLIVYYSEGRVWRFGETLCKLERFLFTCNLYVSIYFIMCISVNRYLAIVHPFFTRKYIRPKHAKMVSVFVWIFVASISSPILYYSGLNGMKRCYLFTKLGKKQSTCRLVMAVIGCLIPFVISFASYSGVLWVVLKNANITLLEKRKVTLIVGLCCILYSVSFVPYHILQILKFKLIKENKRDCNVHNGYQVSKALACLNMCLHPLLYMAVFDSIRTVCCRRRRHYKMAANISSSSCNSSFSKELLPPIYGVEMCVALVGNILALWLLVSKERKNWHTGVVFSCNLIISDIFYALTLPFLIVYYSEGRVWRFGETLCKLERFLFTCNLYVSIYFIMCISVNRYLAIVHPFFTRSYVSPKHAKMVSLLVWILVAGLSSPVLYYAGLKKYRCSLFADSEHESKKFIYRVFMAVIGCMIPFLVTFASYFGVIWVVFKNETVTSLEKKKVALMLIIEIFCSSKPSWADQVEEEGDEGTLPSPKETVKGNIKTVTEYKIDEDGKKLKIIRTFKIETRKASKAVARRKNWKKFGNSEFDAPGPNVATTTVSDDVFMTFISSKEDLNSQDQDEDPMNKLKGQKIVSCRICKGDHWTTRCPYKDTLGPMQKELAEQLGLSTGEKEKAAGEREPEPAQPVQSKTGKYVPPSLRDGGTRRGESMQPNRRADDNATIRVTNLSEDTRETDLQELFRPFGSISRIYLAKDKNTGQSKGFAFISFHRREDAARAIAGVSGFGYDHLILNVEWAK